MYRNVRTRGEKSVGTREPGSQKVNWPADSFQTTFMLIAVDSIDNYSLHVYLRFAESNLQYLYGSQNVITYLQLCPLNLLKMEKHPFCQFLLKFEFWLVSCSA